MKYKCLVLDHDDTAVKSTPDIHYPSFVKAL
ncbi:MAG TPA: hydrolase, partial [Sedimentibacter sp.]|nr:hydrolase [Sedimentibacter sp.]